MDTLSFFVRGFMDNGFSREWLEFALRGLLALVFAMICFVKPGIALASLIALFGAFAFVNGLLLIRAGIQDLQKGGTWGWWVAAQGLTGALAGFATWIWPGITALILLILVASWAIINGVLEIASAIRLRKEIDHEWWLALSGVTALALGVALLTMPASSLIASVYLIGAYALLSGLFLLALGFRLRTIAHGSGRGVLAHGGFGR